MHGAATQCVSALGARLVRGDTFKKDVCTEGEGGGSKYWQILRMNITDGLRKMRMKGGGGPKSRKFHTG